MSSIFEELEKKFSRFPGIGERQAKRFVYFLLSAGESYRKNLGLDIENLGKNIRTCKSCFRFFESTKDDICEICSNEKIDKTTLLVVASDSDMKVIKTSGSYNGKYFILGGLINIPDDGTRKFVRINELRERIKTYANDGLLEVILAFPAHAHGEYTDLVIRKEINNLALPIKISTLGRGLSSGLEIEYSDPETIKNALSGRS
jgi:recombination protein RecR